MLTAFVAFLLAQASTDLDVALDRLAAVRPGDGAAYVAISPAGARTPCPCSSNGGVGRTRT